MANERIITPATEMVLACVQTVQTAVQSIALLKDRTVMVLNEENLMDKLKAVTLPAAGVLYEGLRATPERGAQQVGAMAECVVSVILVTPTPGAAPKADKTPLFTLLDALRVKLMATNSPSGHKWKFIVEAAADEKNGVVFWVQRWSTPVILL